MNEKKRRDLLKGIGIEMAETELGSFEWIQISKSGKLSEEFLREFQENLYWYSVSKYQKMSENIIREFANRVSWYFIFYNNPLSESLIREFPSEVDWYVISERHSLSDDLIEEFKDKICWEEYLIWNYVNYDVMKKNVIKTDLKSTEDFKTDHLNETQKREINKLLKLKQIFQ